MIKFLANIVGNVVIYVGMGLIKVAYHIHKSFKTELGEQILVLERQREEMLNKFYGTLADIADDELSAKSKTKQQYDA